MIDFMATLEREVHTRLRPRHVVGADHIHRPRMVYRKQVDIRAVVVLRELQEKRIPIRICVGTFHPDSVKMPIEVKETVIRWRPSRSGNCYALLLRDSRGFRTRFVFRHATDSSQPSYIN